MLTIVLPLPPSALSPNGAKGSWRPKAAATADYRQCAGFRAAQAMRDAGLWDRPAFERITINATFYCGPTPLEGRYRPLDSTNAQIALKAAIDGLVDVRVVTKDSHESVRLMPPVLLRRAKQHQGRAEVVLEIEPWEGAR